MTLVIRNFSLLNLGKSNKKTFNKKTFKNLFVLALAHTSAQHAGRLAPPALQVMLTQKM